MPYDLPRRFVKQTFQELWKNDFSVIKYLKYYAKWKNSLNPGMNAIVDEQPWITFPVIDFLKERININSKIFEYGAGGSTLFFVNHAGEVISVEHHPGWFATLQEKVNNKSAKNWSGYLVLPENKNIDEDLDASDPHSYYTIEEQFINNTFKSYASLIDRYPAEYFDVVLIDGRSRPSCIWHSQPKIKKGGYLIVDNSNRPHYFPVFEKILQNNFKLIYNQKAPSPYLKYFTQTGVWLKT